MLVTSVTTAGSFFSLYASTVVVIKSFSVFMGTLMNIKYLNVMSILPATMLLEREIYGLLSVPLHLLTEDVSETKVAISCDSKNITLGTTSASLSCSVGEKLQKLILTYFSGQNRTCVAFIYAVFPSLPLTDGSFCSSSSLAWCLPGELLLM